MLRRDFFYIGKTLGERGKYTGYNPVDVDVARITSTGKNTPIKEQ